MKGKKILSFLLALCLTLGMLPGAALAAESSGLPLKTVSNDVISAENGGEEFQAEDTERLAAVDSPYQADDQVRVFIVLEKASTLEKGYSTHDIAANSAAMGYAQGLASQQEAVAQRISRQVLDGEKLNVRWNLTLVANAISADVRYGDIAAMEKVAGVKSVSVVPQYVIDDPTDYESPATISSGTMVGSYQTWDNGYSGAGARIAVIDTGLDVTHPSFDGDAYRYGLAVSTVSSGKTPEDYDLLDAQEIAEVLPELNASAAYAGLTADDLYYNAKVAYGFNYVDETLNITHRLDSQGDHGTHVAGIATANRYVPVKENGTITYAYAENGVVGIAPDAQLLVMKVFGSKGGAYSDDYFAAIEDAIRLNCDVINMSIGSAAPGFALSEEYTNSVMATLQGSDVVLSISAGNSGWWSENTNTETGLLYTEDMNQDTAGSPGSYANALTVASADNVGSTGYYYTVDGQDYVYNDTGSKAFYTLDTTGTGTEYPFVFLGDPTDENDTVKYGGNAADFQALDLSGKIVLISRGGMVSFVDKQKNAMDAGAAGAIVYNNESGSINMSLSYAFPCVSIRQGQMLTMLESAEKQNGVYTGKLTVHNSIRTDMNATGGVISMSSFSSFGVPGDLSLKPEITAPGGSIYSTTNNGTYGIMSGTSMAAPSVAGMAALVAQYLKENGLAAQEDLNLRALNQSLLMGTAVPIMDPDSGVEYSPRRQGAGLANVKNATTSPTYIQMAGDADGKVKAELGDDPARSGVYTVTFTVNNLSDKAASYRLDSSVLAPAVETVNGVDYTSLSDTALDAAVTYSFAVSRDVNGDGTVDGGDVDAILAYVTGAETPANPAGADLDGNGKVEAVDAQILSDLLKGGSYNGMTLAEMNDLSVVTVPAKGSVAITATIALTDKGEAYLNDNFANGSFVEGYLYLRSIADEEGAVNADQSIPFLGYYGSWTEPSMTDHYDYAAGDDGSRAYVSTSGNFLGVRYHDGSSVMKFNGKYWTEDARQAADRLALSSAERDIIATFTFSPLHNFAASALTVTDADTGKVYFSRDLGSYTGAFFYTNGQAWYNTSLYGTINYALTDANGAALPNDTRIRVTLALAPEYNADLDGNITGTLSHGAYWTTELTVDNEAPVLSSLRYENDVISGESSLHFTGRDNQYIAAAEVYDASGKVCLYRVYPEQAAAGETVSASLDITEKRGQCAYLSVVDYAGNRTTYQLDLGTSGGDQPAEKNTGMFAFNTSSYRWLKFEPDTVSTPTAVASSGARVRAAEHINGYVFVVDENNYLQVLDQSNYTGSRVRYLGSTYSIYDMAYNKADGLLYGIAYKGSQNWLVRIDQLTGVLTPVGQLTADDASLMTLACRRDGTFFATSVGADSGLYSFRVENGQPTAAEKVGDTGYGCNYLQSMAFDPADDTLYWFQYYKPEDVIGSGNLLKVNTQTAECTLVSAYRNQMPGLHIVRSESGGLVGSSEVCIQVLPGSLQLYTGNSSQLTAYVTPWNLSDRDVTWTSSDPQVASVSASGTVTAHKAGTATITAAAKADPSKTASCTVQVEELNMTLQGLTHDAAGNEYFASINADTGSVTQLSGKLENDYLSAAQAGETFYAATSDALYSIDTENGYQATKLSDTVASFVDMTYTPYHDVTLAVSGSYVILVDPEAEGSMATAWELQGASLSGITYAGHDTYYSYFYMLVNGKALYLIGLHQSANGKYTLAVIEVFADVSGQSVAGQRMNQSLIYDRSGWIYWARYDGLNSSIIAVNEETKTILERCAFGAESPVVGLYASQQTAAEDAAAQEQLYDLSAAELQALPELTASQLSALRSGT